MSHSDPLPILPSTGISGLDDVLQGGLTPDRMYLIDGTPGTGKNTLGLGFLLPERKAARLGSLQRNCGFGDYRCSRCRAGWCDHGDVPTAAIYSS